MALGKCWGQLCVLLPVCPLAPLTAGGQGRAGLGAPSGSQAHGGLCVAGRPHRPLTPNRSLPVAVLALRGEGSVREGLGRDPSAACTPGLPHWVLNGVAGAESTPFRAHPIFPVQFGEENTAAQPKL